jgi:methyl-accepting chemotaxis protein
MNNWTIGRRITTGFIIVLLIAAALGGFALLKMFGLKQNIFDLGENTVPSLELVANIKAEVQNRMIAIQQLNDTLTPERRADLTKRLNDAAEKSVSYLKKYEALLSDAKDRELWNQEIKLNDELTPIIAKTMDLIAKNNSATPQTQAASTAALEDCLIKELDPAYLATINAVQADFDYNVQLGSMAATTGKNSAASAVLFISISIALAIAVTLVIIWQVTTAVNKALGEITANLDRGALQTAAAARQVSMASNQLSSGASEQASSVEETSTSLEEMSSMIRSTADNAQKAKALATEARADAQNGTNTMEEMMAAMTAIDTSSAEVAKIVKNIDEIAFQTNILALNAAVEAARAGEAGAGFAVVADEVRSLAQRSAAAAKETAEKIEAAIANSRSGSQCSVRVGESLKQIAEKVAATDALVADIATAANEQAQGIQQVNTAMGQMDKVTQSNASSAEESASAAEELDTQAETMKDLVSQLRTLVGGASTGESAPVSRAVSKSASPKFTSGNSGNSGKSGHKGFPMPGDDVSSGGDDASFRNF